MALTARSLAEIVRQRLGVAAAGDQQLIATVNSSIPGALKEMGRRIASDPRTRALLVTDKNTAKVAITTGGKVNLVTLYQTYYALKEFIEYGQMYLLPSATIANASFDATTDFITTTRARFRKYDRVQFSTSGVLPGISAATDYWVCADSTSAGAFQIASSPLRVESGLFEDISGGSGNHVITTFESADHPLQKIAAADVDRYDRQFDSIFRYYFIQGDTLHVRPRSAEGSVAFAVPSYPATLSAMPESAEAENMLIEIMTQTVAESRRGASMLTE